LEIDLQRLIQSRIARHGLAICGEVRRLCGVHVADRRRRPCQRLPEPPHDRSDGRRPVPLLSAYAAAPIAGKRAIAVVPRPTSLLISSLPPWSSMSDLDSGKPSPVPSWARLRLALRTSAPNGTTILE